MSDFVNRNTLKVQRSAHDPAFPDPPWKTVTSAEQSSVAGVDPTYRIIDAGTDLLRAMTDAEIDANALATYKTAKMGAVDLECVRRISLGYTYATKQFSFSLPAQVNLNGLRHNQARFTFPLKASTIDNQDSYDIPNMADAQSMYETASDAKLTLVSDGNTVKHTVRGASTKGAVDTAAASYLGGGPP